MRRLIEWKLMNQPTTTNAQVNNNTSSNLPYKSQKERYEKLLAQIDKEKRFNYNIITLTDNALVFELIASLNDNKKTAIAIVYKPWTNPPVWVMTVGSGARVTGVDYKDWNEVLEVFEVPGIIKDISSLKESSVAEDFELYENLWK